MMEGRARTCKPKITMPMLIVVVHFSSSVVFVVVIIVTLAACTLSLRHSCYLLPYFVVTVLIHAVT